MVDKYRIGLRPRLSLLAGYMLQKRPSDAFIIAHPRSGSTWLRTILTNIVIPEAKSNPDVFNAFIQGVSFRNVREVRNQPSPRLLKSHSAYLPGLPRVLYLVRDGRDVLISFYNYAVFRKQHLADEEDEKPVDFSTFLARYYDGQYGHIWDHHVESWMGHGQAQMGERMMTIRFEDLKRSTEDVIEQVVTFLSIPATSDEISRAVQEASIENARKIEKEEWKRKGLGTPDSRTSFYSAGGRRDWTSFSDDEMKQFLDRSAQALDLAGYPHSR